MCGYYCHFSKEIAEMVKEELENNVGKCYYDDSKKKIVYNSVQDAMQVYNLQQIEKIEKHKWLESEKVHKDLGASVTLEWVAKFSGEFRDYWRITHLFIPS